MKPDLPLPSKKPQQRHAPAAVTPIQLGDQRLPGVLFTPDTTSSPATYSVQPTQHPYIAHVATDDQSRSAHIRNALLAQIRVASDKVMFCSFLFADDQIVTALCEAAERLHGGVYILTALDKHLRQEVLALDEPIDMQTKKLQERARRHDEHLRRLAQAGAWLRSAEDCHAKFCVVDDACAIVTSANATQEAYESNPEDGLILQHGATAREFGRLFAHIWQQLTTLESLPGASLDVGTLPAPPLTPWRALEHTGPARAVTTLRDHENSLLDAALQMIGRAHHRLTIASYSFMGMQEHPLGTALAQALMRGVTIDLLIQPRNHIEAQRDDLGWLLGLAPGQVRIHGHRRTHTKSIVADEQAVLLWTGNLDARHGWYDGIEVGVVVEDQGVAAAVAHWTRNVMSRRTGQTLATPSVRQLAAAGMAPALPGDWELRLPPRTEAAPVIAALSQHPVELVDAPGEQRLRCTNGLTLLVKIDHQRRRLDVQRIQQAASSAGGRAKGWLTDGTLRVRVLTPPPQAQQPRHNKGQR